MGAQFEIEDETKAEEKAESESLSDSAENPLNIEDDAFEDCHHVKDVYIELCREYAQKIDIDFAHLTKAKSQIPPYWNDAKNLPEELPMHQHNVSSGRYTHAISQVALSYNSFFPNQSYSKSLIEVKLLRDAIGLPASKKPNNQLTPVPAPEQQTREESTPYLHDNARLLEQAYDNLIKRSTWAKQEHLKLVSDLLNFGAGIYYFEDPSSYKYKALDFRKCKFPSGSSTNPDDWGYIFVEHDLSFNDLVNQYDKVKNKPESETGWSKNGLYALLSNIINLNTTRVDTDPLSAFGSNAIKNVDLVREGITASGLNYGKVCSVRLPVVSCFWKKKDGTIATNMFCPPTAAFSTDSFLYRKKKLAEYFSECFSCFPADETESEIRMVKGWGHKIHNLCHAYDRAFCKFLDHVDYSATLFLNIDPNDLHKKILHFGSLNIGKYDSVENFPNALQPIIAALAFIDGRIDQATFSRGLNKSELMGEGRGAELASIILTVEGRIHKHLMSRFADRYTTHHKYTLQKLIKIANDKADLTRFPEVSAKFVDYLLDRNVPKDLLKLDDTSYINCGLPSSWEVSARKPDGTALTSSLPHTIELLSPYFSSLPESGFKYLLTRLISDAFGDEDMVEKLLPGTDLIKASTEADLQLAEMQSAILTSHRSEFDYDINLSQDIDPRMSDVYMFETFPPSKENDHFIFAQVLLAKTDDAVERMNKREIGKTTLHIWLYNLVSTCQGHVDALRQDQIRGQRPEASQIYQRFGIAFNLLRRVESEANAERAKKIDALEKKYAEQAQDDPKRIEAIAKLETARAKQSEVALKFSSNRFNQILDLEKNRRSEEAHVVDTRVKIHAMLNDSAKANGVAPKSQSDVGRPNKNEQRGSQY